MDPIVSAALDARTIDHIDSLEALLLKALGGEHVRFLGDQEANWSSISSPADATSVLFERSTNMFDADIELEAERRRIFGCGSPGEAAHTFFGVPRSGIGEMTNAEREKLAAMSLIIVHDSDDSKKRPTIAFRDHGTGMSPTGVPDTILSLQKSNKLRKSYTHGVFGKGGSSADAFSDATVVVTRKQPDLLAAGEEDRITVAVVREDEAPDMGLPYYRYLVGAGDLPYSVPASAQPSFESGTYVAHINYLAGKMGQQNWNNEESIYAYAETILFAPALPYQLQDARSDGANVRPADRREPSVLSGLGQRLEALKAGDGAVLDRTGWQTIHVPDVGDVRLRWWLFDDPDKRRTRVAKGFVVIFTTNGQIHHAWDNSKLQQLVDNRRRVGRALFVQVDCDGIDLRKRYKVFDSFRAQVRRGPEGRALEDAVGYALDNDADLDEYENQLVRQSLQSSAQSISASFRKRLNRALRTRVPGLAPSATKGTGPRPPKPKREEDLHDEPTTITGPAELTLLIAGRATAYMEINAKDGFVPDTGEINLEASGSKPAISVGDLRKGRLPLTFTAPVGMGEGQIEAEVALTWLRKNGGLGRMTWPISVNVVSKIEPKSAPSPKPPKGGQAPTKDGGDVAFIWVNGHDQGWQDNVVGELQDIEGDVLASEREVYADLKGVKDKVPTIVLNKDFADWAAYRRTIAKGASDATLDTRNERYGLAIGIIVANMTLEERKLAKKHDAWEAKQNGSEEPPKAMSPEQMQRALAEAARGVVALMPDFDALTAELEPNKRPRPNPISRRAVRVMPALRSRHGVG